MIGKKSHHTKFIINPFSGWEKRMQFLKSMQNKFTFYILGYLFLGLSISQAQDQSNFFHLDKSFHFTSQIETDSLGYIWISTHEELYKYDGYGYQLLSFKEIFGKNFINKSNVVFHKDQKGFFWIGTLGGDLARIGTGQEYRIFNNLSKDNKFPGITSISSYEDKVAFATNQGAVFLYDYLKDEIEQLTVIPQYNESYKIIQSSVFTDNNNLWVSTAASKIYHFIIDKKELKELKAPFEKNVVDMSYLASKNPQTLWLTTEYQGLFKYDIKNKSFKHYPFEVDGGSQTPMYRSIFIDRAGIIWLGTDGDGLFQLDPETEKLITFPHQKNNQYSISSNTIRNINEDNYGNIWAVQKWGLVDILPDYRKRQEYYSGASDGTPTTIISALLGSDGSLYLGTNGNGLTVVKPNGQTHSYNFNQTAPYFFQGRYAQSLTEGPDKNIWIGTYQNGLFLFNPKTGEFKNNTPQFSNGNKTLDFRTVFTDSKKRVWASSNNGLLVYDSPSKRKALFEFGGPSGLIGNISDCIYETPNKEIWLTTYDGGLYRFKENTQNFSKSSFESIPYYDQENSISLNTRVSSLAYGEQNLWLRTLSGYLIKLDTKTLEYESFFSHEDLKEISISAVEVDENGTLWLSAEEGIYSFDYEKDVLTSYDLSDGLKNMKYARRSIYKAPSGKLFFSGSLGVNAFFPTKLRKLEDQPKLFIKSVEVLNKPAQQIIPEQLQGGIENIQELELKADQSSFSFEFGAIGNVISPDYQYEYRLIGFNENWISSQGIRQASYTNIPAGDYIFEVKAITSAENFNIPIKSIGISIAPYWWNSTIAYIIYFLLIIIVLIGVYFWINLKNKIIRDEWVYNQEKELYALKMNFFAKMSHEIQTPLTLILAPLKDMVKRASKNGNKLLVQRLTLIQNNAERLARISDDLMTVRDKELKKLKLFIQKKDVFESLNKIALSFKDQATFKEIDFHILIPSQEDHIWFDAKKIEHIFYNLLSNAFKFTSRGGEISFIAELIPNEEKLKVTISDTGSGISSEDLAKIFDIYYQSQSGKKEKGMGIGLALTKELVELHHGEIKAKSELGIGTTITVTIPTNESIYVNDEKIIETEKPDIFIEPSDNGDELTNSGDILEPVKSNSSNRSKSKILVVEDNVEMQIFLKEFFQDEYEIELADNGKIALEVLTKFKPDVIISDLMMPVMDGIEMSKKIAKRKALAHIPIILLTAKNNTESRILGLSNGAIFYIQKPFNPTELSLRVNNLLEHQKKTYSRIKSSVASDPDMGKIKTKNDEFIVRLIYELNKEIENADFKLEDLTKSMNMSYSVIFRKCQEITGQSLLEFFRKLKLKRAASLIIVNGYRISEAAYLVGYNDSKYFSKCFKEEFGKTPTEVRREAKNGNPEKIIEDLTKV